MSAANTAAAADKWFSLKRPHFTTTLVLDDSSQDVYVLNIWEDSDTFSPQVRERTYFLMRIVRQCLSREKDRADLFTEPPNTGVFQAWGPLDATESTENTLPTWSSSSSLEEHGESGQVVGTCPSLLRRSALRSWHGSSVLSLVPGELRVRSPIARSLPPCTLPEDYPQPRFWVSKVMKANMKFFMLSTTLVIHSLWWH